MAAFVALHIYFVFFYRFEPLWLAPVAIAVLCWLSVGLFIIAHDAMHGSLSPGNHSVNLWTGRIALALYAGFSFDRLRVKHMEHHRAPGSKDDPDFLVGDRAGLARWYVAFFRRYFGWTELLVLTVAVAAYLIVGARLPNLLIFWALPAILSSVQLFYFGTYLPHRRSDSPFADDHRARTNEFSWMTSLLSCYHFGYHHEHHLSPHVPWWRLPAERRRLRSAR